MVWKDIKVRYAQSVLGIGWAFIRPLAYMVVFTAVFGNLAKISSDGVPYAIFSYTALVPWTYFSVALTASSESLLANTNMLTKIYFPRVALPLAAPISMLLDFGIALVLLFGMMAWFQIVPTIWALFLPVLILTMVLTAAGLGMLFTAMAVHYRDVRYGMAFLIQLLMYASPVVYPVSLIPDRFRPLYGLNPMAGVIEGFRSALLGTNPMPWDLIATGSIVTIIVFVLGALYFRQMDGKLADVA